MPVIVEEDFCIHRQIVIKHIWNVCKHCGAMVYDLENNIGVEWWNDEECGCHRRGN